MRFIIIIVAILLLASCASSKSSGSKKRERNARKRYNVKNDCGCHSLYQAPSIQYSFTA